MRKKKRKESQQKKKSGRGGAGTSADTNVPEKGKATRWNETRRLNPSAEQGEKLSAASGGGEKNLEA